MTVMERDLLIKLIIIAAHECHMHACLDKVNSGESSGFGKYTAFYIYLSLYRYFGFWYGTVYFSSLGHGLGFLRGWRSWSFSVYSGRPRHHLWMVKRTLNLLSFFLLGKRMTTIYFRTTPLPQFHAPHRWGEVMRNTMADTQHG